MGQPGERAGFGTTILEQVIPFDVSGSTVSNYLPEGFAFDITLPPAVATCIERSAPLTAEAKRPEKPARTYLVHLRSMQKTCSTVWAPQRSSW